MPDVAAALERARDDARHRGHEAVDLLHMCAALVRGQTTSAFLAKNRVSVPALAKALDEALAAQRNVVGYRDRPRDVPLSADLAALLAPVRVSFWSTKPVEAGRVFESILEHEKMESLVE